MFTVTHVSGAMQEGDRESLAALLDELTGADAEHPDVAVQHETGLTVSVLLRWRLILESVETDGEPRWAETADRGVVLEVMEAVARNEAAVDDLAAWQPGYGPASPIGDGI